MGPKFKRSYLVTSMRSWIPIFRLCHYGIAIHSVSLLLPILLHSMTLNTPLYIPLGGQKVTLAVKVMYQRRITKW